MRRMRNQFLMDNDLLPFNGQKNLKKKKKTIPWGLRLASNHSQKELKKGLETNFLRIKTCFESMAQGI